MDEVENLLMLQSILTTLESQEFEKLINLIAENYDTVDSIPNDIKDAILEVNDTSPPLRGMCDWINNYDTIARRYYIDKIRNDNIRFFWPFQGIHWKKNWSDGILLQCAQWNQEKMCWDWDPGLSNSISSECVSNFTNLNSLPEMIGIGGDLAHFILNLIDDTINTQTRRQVETLSAILDIKYPPSICVMWFDYTDFNAEKLYMLMTFLPIPAALNLYRLISPHPQCTSEMHALGVEMVVFVGGDVDQFCFDWVHGHAEEFVEMPCQMATPTIHTNFDDLVNNNDYSNYHFHITSALVFIRWMEHPRYRHPASRIIIKCISKIHSKWTEEYKTMWMPAVLNLINLGRFIHRSEQINIHIDIPWESMAIFIARIKNKEIAKEMWALNTDIIFPDFVDLVMESEIEEESNRLVFDDEDEMIVALTKYRLCIWDCSVCAHTRRMHVINPCGHTYCEKCLQQVSRCPNCRQPIEFIMQLNIVN